MFTLAKYSADGRFERTIGDFETVSDAERYRLKHGLADCPVIRMDSVVWLLLVDSKYTDRSAEKFLIT